MKLLIVDQDPTAAALLREAMSALPHAEIKQAATGVDAWMMLTGFGDAFDAVVIDLALPDMDGIGFIARIRARPALQRLPVIVCTSASDRETVTRAAALGVRYYVVKPINSAVLMSKLAMATGAALPEFAARAV